MRFVHFPKGTYLCFNSFFYYLFVLYITALLMKAFYFSNPGSYWFYFILIQYANHLQPACDIEAITVNIKSTLSNAKVIWHIYLLFIYLPKTGTLKCPSDTTFSYQQLFLCMKLPYFTFFLERLLVSSGFYFLTV